MLCLIILIANFPFVDMYVPRRRYSSAYRRGNRRSYRSTTRRSNYRRSTRLRPRRRLTLRSYASRRYRLTRRVARARGEVKYNTRSVNIGGDGTDPESPLPSRYTYTVSNPVEVSSGSNTVTYANFTAISEKGLPLIQIPTGSGASDRIGASVNVRYLNISFNLSSARVKTTLAPLATSYRVIIVRDNHTLSSSTEQSILWSDVFTTNATGQGYLSSLFLRHGTLGRFSIRYDKTYNLTTTNPAFSSGPIAVPVQAKVSFDIDSTDGKVCLRNQHYLLVIATVPNVVQAGSTNDTVDAHVFPVLMDVRVAYNE